MILIGFCFLALVSFYHFTKCRDKKFVSVLGELKVLEAALKENKRAGVSGSARDPSRLGLVAGRHGDGCGSMGAAGLSQA